MSIARSTTILALGWFAVIAVGCESSSRSGQPTQTVVPTFDGHKALTYLQRQVDFGPRVPNSEAHQKCLAFFLGHLKALSDTVETQEFTNDHLRLGKIDLTNVIARFNLQAKRRVMISTHWDSRPWADAERDPAKRLLPVPGANDGASGAAIILALADQLKTQTPLVGVDLVLFDGEDVGASGDARSWCLGSRFFAAHLLKEQTPAFAVNIDMVGDRNLLIARERESDRSFPEIVARVFGIAERLHIGEFSNTQGPEVLDDHIPLIEAGVAAIDLIDFSYPDANTNYWHTTEDTPDKCSKESLEAVGTLLLHLIYEETKQ
ncbi:MAG: M28 family peptidase [Ignavibacteriales bacterium]|nr:M28 family peptidase [Ignavibacteriales bacterium]